MAKGSHATWGAYDSRICCVCGRPIRITVDTVWVHHDDIAGEHRSAHGECGSPVRPDKADKTGP